MNGVGIWILQFNSNRSSFIDGFDAKVNLFDELTTVGED